MPRNGTSFSPHSLISTFRSRVTGSAGDGGFLEGSLLMVLSDRLFYVAKVAVVTGGAGALGRAVCEWFAGHEYDVYLTAISESEKAGYEGPGSVAIAELTKSESCSEWASKLPSEIHAAAMIAGGFAMKPIVSTTDSEMQKMISLNLLTASNALAAIASRLKAANQSGVVFVGSQAYSGAAGMAGYAASKAAVLSFANSAALELKEFGVRVNTIMPDIIDTPANRAAMPNADFDKWQKPDEIAEVIGFLCSDAARIVSGNDLRLSR